MIYRILLVEDDPAWQMTIDSFLDSPKYEITMASSYEEADTLVDRPFDLLIIDLNLTQEIGELRGLRLLKKLRDAEVKTPRIVLSGKPLNARKLMTEYDVYNVLNKAEPERDFSEAAFCDAVDEAIASGFAASLLTKGMERSLDLTRKEVLVERLKLLLDQFEEVNKQLNLTLDSALKVKLKLTVQDLQKEIEEVEGELARLNN